MDQTESDRIQHELETEANELFPGWIRRVELLQHDDAPRIEPGQLMPRLVFNDPADRLQDPHPDPRKVAKAARTFKMAVGPGLNQFRHRPAGAVARDPVHRGDDRRRQRPAGRAVTSGSSKTAARPPTASSPT